MDHENFEPVTLRSTFYNTSTGSSVINSIIIGDLGISDTPITPLTAGLIGKQILG